MSALLITTRPVHTDGINELDDALALLVTSRLALGDHNAIDDEGAESIAGTILLAMERVNRVRGALAKADEVQP